MDDAVYPLQYGRPGTFEKLKRLSIDLVGVTLAFHAHLSQLLYHSRMP